MRKLFAASILALSVCASVIAQTDKTLPCPNLDITGPAGIPSLDEPIVLTATLSKEAENFELKYKWTVSNAEVIEGQESLTVKVLLKDLEKALTASFDISGLPKECASTGSVSVFIDFAPEAYKVSEFSIPISQIEKTRLDKLRRTLNNNPRIIAFIIEHFDKKSSRQAIARKNKLITDYLKNNGVGRDKFVLLNALANENLTRLFIVAPGVKLPICDACITVEVK